MKSGLTHLFIFLSFNPLLSMEKNSKSKPLDAAHVLSVQIMASLLGSKNPNTFIIPKWPNHESAPPRKCRTVAQLVDGPHKGEKATIERSGWSEWGIDTLSSCPLERLNGEGIPLFVFKFFADTDVFDKDARVPLYMGKIDDISTIIPNSWLSPEDEINLFNFHRYELETLSDQLFCPHQSENPPARQILMEKIKNEKYRDSNSNVFLHAVFLEALKKKDASILYDPTILYNSFYIVNSNLLKNVKRKDDDPADVVVRATLVNVWINVLAKDSNSYFNLMPRELINNYLKNYQLNGTNNN